MNSQNSSSSNDHFHQPHSTNVNDSNSSNDLVTNFHQTNQYNTSHAREVNEVSSLPKQSSESPAAAIMPPPPDMIQGQQNMSLPQFIASNNHSNLPSNCNSSGPNNRATLPPRQTQYIKPMDPSQIEKEINGNTKNDGNQNQAWCNCKKSRCLKLYCQCFAAQRSCDVMCNCSNCHNNDQHSDLRDKAIKSIIERNPDAFKSKFRAIDGSEDSNQILEVLGTKLGNTEVKYSGNEGTLKSVAVVGAIGSLVPNPDKVVLKAGCKCKKSNCMKKYCECFNAGVKCSDRCICTNCHNRPNGFNDGNNSGPNVSKTGSGISVDNGRQHIGTNGSLFPQNFQQQMNIMVPGGMLLPANTAQHQFSNAPFVMYPGHRQPSQVQQPNNFVTYDMRNNPNSSIGQFIPHIQVSRADQNVIVQPMQTVSKNISGQSYPFPAMGHSQSMPPIANSNWGHSSGNSNRQQQSYLPHYQNMPQAIQRPHNENLEPPTKRHNYVQDQSQQGNSNMHTATNQSSIGSLPSNNSINSMHSMVINDNNSSMQTATNQSQRRDRMSSSGSQMSVCSMTSMNSNTSRPNSASTYNTFIQINPNSKAVSMNRGNYNIEQNTTNLNSNRSIVSDTMSISSSYSQGTKSINNISPSSDGVNLNSSGNHVRLQQESHGSTKSHLDHNRSQLISRSHSYPTNPNNGYISTHKQQQSHNQRPISAGSQQLHSVSNGVSNSNAVFNSSSCSAISTISAVTINSHESSVNYHNNNNKRKFESHTVMKQQQCFSKEEKLSPANANGISSGSSNSTPTACASTGVVSQSTTTPSSISTMNVENRPSINSDDVTTAAAAALLPPASNPSLEPTTKMDFNSHLPVSSVLTNIRPSRSSPSRVCSGTLILQKPKSPLAYQKNDNYQITSNTINLYNHQENENTHNNGPRKNPLNIDDISSDKQRDNGPAQCAS